MATRDGYAEWRGDLKDGSGTVSVASGLFSGQYSFSTRFEEAPGTNPEELVAAAHAACFSMALSNILAGAGHPPDSVTHHRQSASAPGRRFSHDRQDRPHHRGIGARHRPAPVHGVRDDRQGRLPGLACPRRGAGDHAGRDARRLTHPRDGAPRRPVPELVPFDRRAETVRNGGRRARPRAGPRRHGRPPCARATDHRETLALRPRLAGAPLASFETSSSPDPKAGIS